MNKLLPLFVASLLCLGEHADAETKQKKQTPAAPADIQLQPMEFKKYKIGDPYQAVLEDRRFTCRDRPSEVADKSCSFNGSINETIAGAFVKTWSLDFFADRLESIYVTFSTKRFDDALAALSEKYGKPELTSETVNNRLGATFENTKAKWRRKDGSIDASRYGFDLETASLMFSSTKSLQEFEVRRATKASKNASDL